MTTVSMRDMIEAGAHFGHQTRFWCPKMAPYIYGAREKVHIINLEKTLPLFEDAMNFLGSIAGRGGTVLFVGTKRQARESVEEKAKSCAMPYVSHRWLGGMLTNYRTVRHSVDRLVSLEELFASSKIERLSKKERQGLVREHAKLARSVGGIKEMSDRPDALFVIDVGYESIAVTEAGKLGIPVVAVVDTNNPPDGIDYVIPGNDDSIRAIDLYLSAAAEAINTARSVGRAAATDEFVEVVDGSA